MKARRTIAVGMLLVFGLIRLPFERRLEEEGRAAFFHGAKFDLALRQQMSQMAFVAAFSGFRALVAEALFLHAHVIWSDVDWGGMKVDYDAITALQPRCILFWDMAAWHMAYNASIAAYNDKKQVRQALREKAQREYWDLGKDYLLRGIANNPDVPKLYESLGVLYRDKYGDHCKAAEYFAKCASSKNAPVYVHRFVAYELAKCPGHEREAYEQLLALYKKGEQEHLPTLLKSLGNLQEKLNIPTDQKVYIPPTPDHP
jgi:hypothetical protein